MEPKKTDKANLENKRGLFLQIGLAVSLGVILLAFEWSTRDIDTGELKTDQQEAEEEIIPITRQQEVKPPPPPPPPQVVEEITIVEDDVEIEDELDLGDVEADQDMAFDIVEFEEEEEAAAEEVFFIVEDMPSFKGGDLNDFRTWVQKNMTYPTIAQENGISGRVIVQFAVNSNGEVVDVRVVRGVDPSLDNEAIRAVKSSPKWAPGKQRGKPVKVQFTMPVVFVLN
ncbi:MAG: TonB family protein [Bacteroidetes bacterium]|jgi:protein TonB|nr:TonB family protein [Bacteroidota bacterium]